MPSNNLAEVLGLEQGMSTYFAHAPAEYFKLLNHKTYTHRPDEDGTFQFIHGFYLEKDQLEASFGILASKLADDGVLWISSPKNNSEITKELLESLAKNNFLKPVKEAEFSNWLAYQFAVA